MANKYGFALKGGGTLTLEGDTEPSAADVEEVAKAQGVELVPIETPKQPEKPLNVSGLPMGIAKGVAHAAEGAVMGPLHFAMHPLDSLDAAAHAQLDQADQAKAAFSSGHPLEGMARTAAAVVPFAGPFAAHEVEKVSSGNPEQIGEAIGEVGAPLAAPLIPRTVRGGMNLANRGVQAVLDNPALAAAAGAGIGYAHSGPGSGILGALEGALAGATGSSIAGRGGRILALARKLGETEEEETPTRNIEDVFPSTKVPVTAPVTTSAPQRPAIQVDPASAAAVGASPVEAAAMARVPASTIPASRSSSGVMSRTPGLTENDVRGVGLNPNNRILAADPKLIEELLLNRANRRGTHVSQAQMDAYAKSKQE